MAIPITPPNKSVQILTYHGKSFVTGLFWHPLGSLNGYMREARQFGRQEKMDIVAIRHTESIIQAGFVARSAGAVKGMYSLAATLAGQLGSSWFAAWKLNTDEERFALVAVFEGAVIPGYDLVGTAEEVKRKVGQLMSRQMKFDRTYLPIEFDPEAQHLNIEELLSPANLKREYQLSTLAFGLSSHELMRLGALCGVLTLCLIGWQQWSAHKARLAQEAAIAAEKQRQAALEALNKQTQQQQTIQALEHPWAKLPPAHEFIDTCTGAIDRLALSITGWPFSSAKCEGETVTATFTRGEAATSEDFLRATEGYFLEAPMFTADGNSAIGLIKLSFSLAGDGPLQDSTTALSQLRSWLHAQKLTPTFTELADKAPQVTALPGQPGPAPMATPDWKHFDVKYTSQLPPAIALRGVPDIGLRIRGIETTLQNDQLNWTVTGDLYAK